MEADDHAPTRTEPALPADALATLERSMAMTNGSGRGPRSMARRLGPLTSILVLGVVAAMGFIGGVEVQKREGGTGQVAAAGPGGAGAGGGAAARGQAAAGATSTTAGAIAAEATEPSITPPAGPAGPAARRAAGQGGPAGTGGGAAPAGAAGAAPGGGAAAGGPRAAVAAGAATAGQVKLIDGPNIYVTDAQGNVVKVVTSESSRFTKTGAGSIQDVRPGDTVVVQGQKGADGIVTATVVANSGNAGAP